MNTTIYKIILLCVLALFSSCRKQHIKDDFTNVTTAGKNIKEATSFEGRQLIMYIKDVGVDQVRSVIPFENIYEFNNYDVIDIASGEIRLSDITDGQQIKPGSITGSIDPQDLGVKQIFITIDNVIGNQAALTFGTGGASDTIIDGKNAYRLEKGLPFTFSANELNAVEVSLKLLVLRDDGSIDNLLLLASAAELNKFKTHVKNGIAYGISPFGIVDAKYRDNVVLTFRNKKDTQKAVESIKDAFTSSSDTYLLSLITAMRDHYNAGIDKIGDTQGYQGDGKFYKKKYFIDEDTSGFKNIHVIGSETRIKDIYPFLDIRGTGRSIPGPLRILTFGLPVSWDISEDRYHEEYNRKVSELTTLGLGVGDTFFVGTSEKSMVDASRQNAKILLDQNLLKIVDSGFRPNANMPRVGSDMDDYFVLYSQLDKLFSELDKFKDTPTLKKSSGTDFSHIKLVQSLNTVLGEEGLKALNPGTFSHIILWYTDYLLYAGLNSYLDGDYYSRYINFHNNLVSEVGNAVGRVKNDYDNNNIVIRYYAVRVLYDMLLGKDWTNNFNEFTTLLSAKVDTAGEYGEGSGYMNYVMDIALPIMYIAMRENPTGVPQETRELFTKMGQYMLRSTTHWGEQIALDDGTADMPYLAPFASITTEADNSKYLSFTRQIGELRTNGLFTNLEDAERCNLTSNQPLRVLMYPADITATAPWRSPEDVLRVDGSIVNIPSNRAETVLGATVNTHLNLSIIAEKNPASGGSHDQIDHGAIQFSRYTETGNDANPHVDKLIVDPGYPSFSDGKREKSEFLYPNQNVQLLLDTDISFEEKSSDTDHGNSNEAEEPGTGDHDSEELLGYDKDKNFATYEKFNYLNNGGMTGYRYLTPDEFIDMAEDYVLSDGMQDNRWETVWTFLATELKNKILSKSGSEGKSEVLQRYDNGIELKISYKYPKKQTLFKFEEGIMGKSKDTCFYYNRDITYEESHHGIRGVYEFEGIYYVVDELPEDNLPSSISLANTWNLPKNSQAMDPTATGADSWKRFVYEGTTPSGEIPNSSPAQNYIERSRIELSVVGANTVAVDSLKFNRRQGPTMYVKHLMFRDTSRANLLVTSIRCGDALSTISPVTASSSVKIGAKGMRWERSFADGSSTIFVYNPNNDSLSINGVMRNARVILVHRDSNGNVKGREYLKMNGAVGVQNSF